MIFVFYRITKCREIQYAYAYADSKEDADKRVNYRNQHHPFEFYARFESYASFLSHFGHNADVKDAVINFHTFNKEVITFSPSDCERA